MSRYCVLLQIVPGPIDAEMIHCSAEFRPPRILIVHPPLSFDCSEAYLWFVIYYTHTYIYVYIHMYVYIYIWDLITYRIAQFECKMTAHYSTRTYMLKIPGAEDGRLQNNESFNLFLICISLKKNVNVILTFMIWSLYSSSLSQLCRVTEESNNWLE